MEWYWFAIAAAINWGALFLLWVYPLTMLAFKDFVFEGFYGPFAKFRLATKEDTDDPIEPWHAKMWADWGGVGLGLFMCYRDRPTKADDEWVARTIVHEGTHCWQWSVLGISFFVIYKVHVLWIFITQRIIFIRDELINKSFNPIYDLKVK